MPRNTQALIRKGVSGVFMKHESPALLIQAIRETMNGKATFGQDLLRRALEKTDAYNANQGHSKLSEREKQVLSLVFEGLANKQIAAQLTHLRDHSKSLFTTSFRVKLAFAQGASWSAWR